MSERIYIVRDLVFLNQGGKYNGKRNAIVHCKKNKIDTSEIIELYSETELEYYKLLKDRDVKSLSIHQPMLVQKGFNNANEDFIPPVMVDVPFRYIDDKGIHYDWVVGKAYELDTRLVNSKFYFDKYYLTSDKYLRLIYKDTDGQFKEFTISETNDIRRKYQIKMHKEMLRERKALRDRQVYDRLMKLRNEGLITESQTKELYRLEELYGTTQQGH